MALGLFYSTLLSVAVFLPIAYYFYQQGVNSNLSNFVLGGAAWSVVAIIQLIILQVLRLIFAFPLANNYVISTFMEVQRDSKGILFWYILSISIIGQVILYLGTEIGLRERELRNYVLYGLGWGISEFVHRFLFIEVGYSILTPFFLMYTVLVATAIGSTIIRTSENTKFIMFAAFMKFFGELSIFGGLGNGFSHNLFITQVGAVAVLIVILCSLSILTQKYPLREDQVPTSG